MNPKTYFSVTGLIFLVVAILHIARIVYGWEALIGSFVVPMWLSWGAVIIAGFLSYTGLRSR